MNSNVSGKVMNMSKSDNMNMKSSMNKDMMQDNMTMNTHMSNGMTKKRYATKNKCGTRRNNEFNKFIKYWNTRINHCKLLRSIRIKKKK